MLDNVVDNIAQTYIAPSVIHGDGLMASGVIDSGSLLGVLDGQVVSWDYQFRFGFVQEWNALEAEKVLVRPYKTKYFYINHSRDPNIYLKVVGIGSIEVRSARRIELGEELTLDYRKEPLPDPYVRGHGASYL